MSDSKEWGGQHAPHGHQWPSGNVNECHLYECMRCHHRWRGPIVTKAVVRRPVTCPKCFALSVRPIGLLHLER